jgi:fructoselysine-6-P-deglycase FrlB-like protein
MTRDALSPVHPLVIGRGDSMSTAKEGTLKVMETNALAASDWSVADAAHGPLGQVTAGTPVVVLTASPCELESVATFSAAAPDLWADILLSEGVDLSTVGIGHAVEHRLRALGKR